MLFVLAARDAAFGERAVRAQRIPARADGGADIHDRLRVHLDLLVRRALIRERPQLFDRRALGEIAFDAEVARQHALHVAIENRESFVPAQRENRAGGGAADAGQARHLIEGARELAAKLIANAHGRAMQIARARVVAEAGPEVQHVVDRRIGQRRDAGEALHEAQVIRHDRRDLRLLKHDLRHPHAIRRAVVLPGKIVPAVPRVPIDRARPRWATRPQPTLPRARVLTLPIRPARTACARRASSFRPSRPARR